MLQDRVQNYLDLIKNSVDGGLLPGAVTLVSLRGKTLALRAFGYAQLVPDQEKMRPDTLFDIASLTKLTGVWPGIMHALGCGDLHLDTRLADVLDAPMHTEVAPRTVFELLTHTAGLQPCANTQGNTRAERIRSLLMMPPAYPAGTRVLYSDLSFIFLGEMLSALYRRPLDLIAGDFWRALGMKSTFYNPPANSFCAATEIRAGTILPVRGYVHDERAVQLGGIAGHAGVFSTAEDLGKFCAAILPGQIHSLFPEEYVRMSYQNQTAHLGENRCLGWIAYRERPQGNVVGHTGFTGTSIWMDTVSGLCCVLLTNRIHPSRENHALAEIRSEGLNILYG